MAPRPPGSQQDSLPWAQAWTQALLGSACATSTPPLGGARSSLTGGWSTGAPRWAASPQRYLGTFTDGTASPAQSSPSSRFRSSRSGEGPGISISNRHHSVAVQLVRGFESEKTELEARTPGFEFWVCSHWLHHLGCDVHSPWASVFSYRNKDVKPS